MTKLSAFNRILVMLCLLAIPCAQLFGVRKVFHCDCSGTVVGMIEDRCFGTHGEDCHPHGHDDGPEGDGENSHRHAETNDGFVTSALSLKPIALPPPVTFDAFRLELPIFQAATLRDFRLRLETFSDPPPDPNPARHSILLI